MSFIGLVFLRSSLVFSDNFNAPAKHAFALESSTGKILYAKDSNTPVAIASTTKLLTIYLVYQAIEQGRIHWDTPVSISDYAYELTSNWEISNVPMTKRSYTVKELVDASLLASSNSAAIALAEHLAGSEPAFVDLMKRQLETWGITDAKLVNVTGLNNAYLGNHIYPNSQKDDENMMSAKSLATIAYHLIRDFPSVLTITRQSSGSFDGNPIQNTNAMLPGMPQYRKEVDGLKTGSTERAGHCFVSTATVNNMRVITVILNADNPKDDPNARFEATNALLNHIEATFEPLTLFSAGEKVGKVPVKDGEKETAVAILQNDFTVITTKTLTNPTPAKLNFTANLKAPVRANQHIGDLTYQDTNLIDQGYLDAPPSLPLVAQDTIETKFILEIWWDNLVNYINEKL